MTEEEGVAEKGNKARDPKAEFYFSEGFMAGMRVGKNPKDLNYDLYLAWQEFIKIECLSYYEIMKMRLSDEEKEND